MDVDVLKVLAFNNDKTVRETVVSSFLNYFLDPQGDHGVEGNHIPQQGNLKSHPLCVGET